MAAGLPLPSNAFCACPPTWDWPREQFNAALGKELGPPTQCPQVVLLCNETAEKRMLKAMDLMVEAPRGHHDEIVALSSKLYAEGSCLAGLTALCYSCLALAWCTYDHRSMRRLINLAAHLFAWSYGCFEGIGSDWHVTTGQMWQQLREVISGQIVDWAPHPLPLCFEDPDRPVMSLVGYCGMAPVHVLLRLEMGDAVAPILESDIVLCTHTTVSDLSQVDVMLRSWGGAASVAVLAEDLAAAAVRLVQWRNELRSAGVNKLVITLVGVSRLNTTDYDSLYPANVLRQVAADAAVGDLVLMADPGFVPSVGLLAQLAADAPVGAGFRAVLSAMPAAFLVATFLTWGNESSKLSFQDLRDLVDTGGASSFDNTVCPSCRPYSWQWLLLTDPSTPRFREVEPGDLYHPFWLIPRRLLPRFPPYLHGLVGPRSCKNCHRWGGLPIGLKVCAEQLKADGVRLLLLPGGFLAREEALPPPSHHWEGLPAGLGHNHWGYWWDILFLRLTATLSPGAGGVASPFARASPLKVPRTMLARGQLVEVVPARSPSMVTLQTGGNPDLQLMVMASTILGSEGLERLLSSVADWTVNAICLGAHQYWACTLEELPPILRSFPPDAVIVVVDAYDVVLLPCRRAILDEYLAYGRDIVWAADTTCYPNREICRTCIERYGEESPELEACEAFPHLNGGCYMGRAWALADVLDWIRQQGPALGTDDQEQKTHAYNHFPERIVLDHRQRIFTVLFGCDQNKFRIEGCSVFSDYTREEVCFVHANGGKKWEILDPMWRELQDRNCQERLRIGRQGSRQYAGLASASPSRIWD